MAVYERRSKMPVSAHQLLHWHFGDGAFARLQPPWESVEVVAHRGRIQDGGQVVLKARIMGVQRSWVARHATVEDDHFVDIQEAGPFKRWVHTHRAVPDGDHSVLHDHVDYTLPFGALGRVVAGRSVARRLERLFRWRHERMAADLARPPTEPQRIAITGASGLLGGHLSTYLTTRGHNVRPVLRGRPASDEHDLLWDAAKGLQAPSRWNGLDTVVHLAGETIAQRWTEAAKKRIWESRVPATKRLCEGLTALDEPPKTLVSASAIGYYGDNNDPIDETAPRGDGFLAELVEAWEDATQAAQDAGIRVAHPRTGIVLSSNGGALPPLLRVAKLGAGGPIAGGKQWFPWVHIDDEVYAIEHLATHDVHGAANVVAPGIVQQKDFAKALGRVIRRPSFAPLPKPAVRAMFGEMGKELFEFGQRLRPTVLERTGFQFTHPDLEAALRHELGRPAS